MVYNFQYGLCNESYYGKCVKYLTVSGDDIGISPLTNRKVQHRRDSAVCHHLLNCNYSAFFEDFSVLRQLNKKFLLELKGSLLIMRDRASMNQNIRSSPLYLFE